MFTFSQVFYYDGLHCSSVQGGKMGEGVNKNWGVLVAQRKSFQNMAACSRETFQCEHLLSKHPVDPLDMGLQDNLYQISSF